MQVIETLNDGLRRGFEVTLAAADLASRGESRLAELGRDLRLPGFRPGKVPLSVVRQRYGGAVRAEIVEKSVSEATAKLLGERGLRPASEPRVGLKDEAGAIEPDRDLAFTVELELLPEITVPDLGAIALERLVATPDDASIDKALEEVRKRNRTFEDVDEVRPAAVGDVLVTDFVGTIDGIAFPGGTATDIAVEVGGEGFIPGFTTQLEGLSPGDARTIHVTFPDDYQATELAGKAAAFEVTAKTLRRTVEPALDDALAKSIGFDDLGRVRDAVREQMSGEYRQISRLRIKRALLDRLSEGAASKRRRRWSRRSSARSGTGSRPNGRRGASTRRIARRTRRRCGPSIARSPSGGSSSACCSPRSGARTGSRSAPTRWRARYAPRPDATRARSSKC